MRGFYVWCLEYVMYRRYNKYFQLAKVLIGIFANIYFNII